MRASVLLLVSLMAVGSMGWPQWVGYARPNSQARGQMIKAMQSRSWKVANQAALLRHTTLGQMSEDTREELRFMAEFSRFMNNRIPHLLQEFANRKRITSTKRKVMMAQRMLRQPKDASMGLRRNGRQIVDEVGDAVVDVVDTVGDAAVDAVGTVGDAVENVADATGDVVEGAVEAVDDVGEAVVDVVDAVGDNVENVVDEVVDSTVDIADAVDPTGTVGDVVEGATDAASDIGDNAAALATDIIDALTDSGADVVDLFQDIISSVGEVLEDTIPPSAWNYMCLATWWPIHEEHCETARCAACGPAITSATEVCKRSFDVDVATHKCVQTVMGEGFCNYCIDDYL